MFLSLPCFYRFWADQYWWLSFTQGILLQLICHTNYPFWNASDLLSQSVWLHCRIGADVRMRYPKQLTYKLQLDVISLWLPRLTESSKLMFRWMHATFVNSQKEIWFTDFENWRTVNGLRPRWDLNPRRDATPAVVPHAPYRSHVPGQFGWITVDLEIECRTLGSSEVFMQMTQSRVQC